MAARAYQAADWALPTACAALCALGWLIQAGPEAPALLAGLLSISCIGFYAGQVLLSVARALAHTRRFVLSLFNADEGPAVQLYRKSVGLIHLGLSAQFLTMAGVAVLVWILIFTQFVPRVDDQSLSAAFVAAVAGAAATAGWIYSSYTTARNAQRQNTITLLLNMRHSEIYSRHFNNAYFILQDPALIANRDGLLKGDLEAKWRREEQDIAPTQAPQAALPVRSCYQSVIYVLNYYEFIAAGVRRGALDATIVFHTISAHLHLFHDKFARWIEAERNEANSNAPYEHLTWYKWKFPKAAKRPRRQPSPALSPATSA